MAAPTTTNTTNCLSNYDTRIACQKNLPEMKFSFNYLFFAERLKFYFTFQYSESCIRIQNLYDQGSLFLFSRLYRSLSVVAFSMRATVTDVISHSQEQDSIAFCFFSAESWKSDNRRVAAKRHQRRGVATAHVGPSVHIDTHQRSSSVSITSVGEVCVSVSVCVRVAFYKPTFCQHKLHYNYFLLIQYFTRSFKSSYYNELIN